MTHQIRIRFSLSILLLTLLITPSHAQQKRPEKPIPKVTGARPLPPGGVQPGLAYDPLLVAQYIRTIFHDSKGNYWFGAAGESVARYDEKTLHYFSKAEFFKGNELASNGSSIYATAEDKNGNIWFGSDFGVVKYDGKNFSSYTEKNGLTCLNVGRKGILSDRSGTLWIGTKDGAFRYNAATDSFSLFTLIPANAIKDIMEDKAGNIWFATAFNGVFRYDGKTIKNIKDKERLGDNYAGGMIQDKAGNIWFVMQNGITKYDGKTFTDITAKDGLGGSEFWGIAIENSGIIWVTARGATTRFDPSLPLTHPKAFKVFHADEINCCVQSMHRDRDGNMWWGTGAGLYRFDGEKFYQVKQNGPW